MILKHRIKYSWVSYWTYWKLVLHDVWMDVFCKDSYLSKKIVRWWWQTVSSFSIPALLFIILTCQGSTNCMHGDNHAQCACKEVFTCTKLHACKSIKTLLNSAKKLFKVTTCFFVWIQIFDTTRSDIHNLFRLRSCYYIWLYLVLCSTCENNFNSTHRQSILNCMWFCLVCSIKDL